jgi:hypothetical protein
MASHFAAGGAADGFMPRSGYLALMIGLIVGLPLLLALLQGLLRLLPISLINLPHRDYWLAPERREETLAFVAGHGNWFGLLLAGFLALVHGLVVRAHRQQPPRLEEAWLVAALVVLMGALVLWIALLVRRFARRP